MSCRRPSRVIHRPSTGRTHRVAHRPRPTRRVNCISLLLRRESARCASSQMTPACTGPIRPYLEPADRPRGWSDGSAFRPINVGPGAAPLGLLNLRPQATGPRSLPAPRSHLLGAGRVKRRPRPAACIRSARGASVRASRPPDRRKKTPSRGAARFDPLAVPRSSKKRDRKLFPKSTLFERFHLTLRHRSIRPPISP
jgi:hypothetical protein